MSRWPLLVSNGWDDELRRLRDRDPLLRIITVTAASDLRSASEQIAAQLLSGGEVRCRRIAGPVDWLDVALESGGAIFRQTVGTLQLRVDEWLANLATQPREWLGLPSVDQLRGVVPDELLVLGAGPSLDRLGTTLVTLTRTRPTLAVGSALAPLHERGIVPDFAAVIEAADCSRQFAPPVELQQIGLIVAQHGHPAHRRLRAAAIWRADLVETGWLSAALGLDDPLPSGGNVGAFCVALAARLGARRILLAGLDFAVDAAGDDHARHATSPAFAAQAGDRLDVPGWGGGIAASNTLLSAYRLHLEGLVRSLEGQVEVINLAGPGTAHIAGTEDCFAADWLVAHPLVPFDRTELRAQLAGRTHPTIAVGELSRRWLTALARFSAELDEIERLGSQLQSGAAPASRWRAELGGYLAERAMSFGSVLIRGFLLDPARDPRSSVAERLAQGRQWIAQLQRELGAT